MFAFCVILCAILANVQSDPCKLNLNCGKNEVENPCPKFGATDPDCESLLSGFKKNCAPAPDNYQCTPRCDCKKDFVRIGTNCVSADQCCVGKNEEITDCPADCDDTCLGEPFPGCKLIPCFNKGCHCKKGFVRNNGACIILKDCPEKVETPQIFKALQSIGGKAKQAANNALKKAGKAKVVTSKNFMKRNDTVAALNSIVSPITKVVLPILSNITASLKPLTVKTGLPGKPVPEIAVPCDPPSKSPLQAAKDWIQEKLTKK